MFAERIFKLGNGLKNRLDQGLLDGALDYVNFNEEPLAFEILCEHICEYDVAISKEEYEYAMKLAQEMGFDVMEAPFKYLQDLVVC